MFERMEVAEVYRPPRIVEMARKTGLRAGWILDLTTYDEHGRPWDFNCKDMRNAAIRKVMQDKPILSIGSPMCVPFSNMNNINYSRMSTEEKNQRPNYGRQHLELCMKFYELQWREGRYFLHEHPATARSWGEDCVMKMMTRQGVVRVVGDQCRFGLKSSDGYREGPARKRTGFMTNSPCIIKRLNLLRPNQNGQQIHDHVVFINGRAKAAEIYPPGLCRAMCEGFIEQLEADRKGQFLFFNMNIDTITNSKQFMDEAKKIKEKHYTVEEDDQPQFEIAWDDVSGAELDPKVVRQARREEIEYVREMDLCNKVTTQECYAKIRKAPITVRWIDINKGDGVNPNYRSRLVAREINTHKCDDLFARIPPLEALNSILPIIASGNKRHAIMVNDVSRASFHAKARREVYVQFAGEDKLLGDENKCARLNYSMYGIRDAAQNWVNEYADMLVSIGFTQGKAFPCVFHHQQRGIRTFVHGDDYVSTAMPNQLEWLKTSLEAKYQIKTQWLGQGEKYSKEVKILKGIVGWDGVNGITFEADPRHAEIIINQLKIQDAKAVSTPGTKDEGINIEDCEEPLGESQATQYRAIIARCNYFTPDRPDLAFTAKELARKMSKPIKGDWQTLKRLGRYLVDKPRLRQLYQWQGAQRVFKTYTHADWAGCRESRKSTTGGCAILGTHTLQGWSKTQTLIAFSSGESELYVALKASAETLGMVSLM